MKVENEEILHIADLADLILEDDEIEQYVLNLEEILNFANIVNNAPIEELDVTIGSNETKNVFRKDEIEMHSDTEQLLQNAKTIDQNMFKLPKII